MNRRTFARNIGTALSSTALLPLSAIADPVARASHVRYKLSVMLWTVFRELPFERRLEKVAEAGYKNVELVGEFQKWAEAEFKNAIGAKKRLGINFDCTAGVNHSLCNPAERDALLAEIRATLPVMEKLECPALILLSGNVVPGMTREAQAQSCIDGLRAAAPIVDGKRINNEPVRLLLENIDPEENPKYFLTSVAEGFEIVKAVNHAQVQFLYDFFHEQISEGNLIEKLEKNIEHVGLVHIADVPGRHAPGTGEINYANIFRKLAELKYDRVVAMEFLPQGNAVAELGKAKQMALSI